MLCMQILMNCTHAGQQLKEIVEMAVDTDDVSEATGAAPSTRHDGPFQL